MLRDDQVKAIAMNTRVYRIIGDTLFQRFITWRKPSLEFFQRMGGLKDSSRINMHGLLTALDILNVPVVWRIMDLEVKGLLSVLLILVLIIQSPI